MKKIRFTKAGFFGIEAGSEHEAFEEPEIPPFIRIPDTNSSIPAHLTIRLLDMEGWYEVVRHSPELGERYYFIDASLVVMSRQHAGDLIDTELLKAFNCFPYTNSGSDLAIDKAEQMRAIFKEGVRDVL